MFTTPLRFFALLLFSAMVHASSGSAIAQYSDWKQSGSLILLTTSEGADLPADVSNKGFPLLMSFIHIAKPNREFT